MILRLCFIVCILAVIPIRSHSAVLSIDLGSEWMKVAVVKLKPGQIPISIAINEMSKRKTPSLVAFHSGSRFIGEEAAGLIARYPDKVYAQIRDFIGKPYNYTKSKMASSYLPYQLVEDERGAASIKVDDGSVYSFEEMLAMALTYAMTLAEFHSKVPIRDAVITVPPYFGQAERKGLLNAAQLAGLNVLSLINEHSGAALQYGIDKNFANESKYVVFYDMGASSTYAALVYYSSYNAKEFGKTVSVNQFQVKDVKWNPQLGGQDMELRLVEYFVEEINKQIGNGVDIRQSPKAMAKLKKQVKRTKEILSANTMAPISVESVYDDQDFRSTISRQKFEELSEDLWDQALVPLKELLQHSGLKIEDLHAIELIGGATRVPKLQVKLQEFLGRKELDKHLDADEATVLGASLHAANLSDGIKLNRKLGMIDGSTYAYLMELNGPDLVKDETTKQVLVPRMKKVPSKMFRSIFHNKDFEVTLAYDNEDALPLGVSSPVFAHYAVSGLADANEKYSSRNLSSPIKANLHFSLSRSGVLVLDRVEAVIEITEWVDVPKKNLTVGNSTNSVNVTLDAPASADLTSDGGATDSGSNVNGSNKDDSPSSTNGENSTVVTEKKLKKRTFRVPLKLVEKSTGPGISLAKETLAGAKRKLEDLDMKDAERRRTAESKNNLEGYIYGTRDKIESSEDVEKVSTAEERQSFIQKLEEIQDWLYMDGEDASAKEFEERLDILKAIGDPIFFRSKELSERPAAIQQGRKYINGLKEIKQGWETNKPWISKEKVNEVSKSADEFTKWLDEKEAEQTRTPSSSKPVLTSEDVYLKLFDVQDKVGRVNRIPKPKPKVEKPAKNETGGTKADQNATDSTSKTSEDNSDGSTQDKAESENHDEL